MSFDLGEALTTIQEMVDGFVALLPNLVIATLVFVVFLLLAGVVRNVVRGFGQSTGMADNAVTVVSRCS